MRIDRKSGSLHVSEQVPSTAAPSLKVEPTGEVNAPSDSLFTRMRSGVIDVSAYLNQKVEDATAHLRGLAPSEASFIKAELRHQLETTLADLVQLATT